ncbi:MAG: penicillin-binding protein 1A [Rhodospirillales bacterium]|nr:MAG: penicillin-binding protein 1A [Rhodospirillales bacterium]
MNQNELNGPRERVVPQAPPRPEGGAPAAPTKRRRRRPRFLVRVLAGLFGITFLAVLGGVAVIAAIIYGYSSDLPDYAQLADYEPPVTTRVYAGDGRLLAEYAIERRVFRPLDAMPQMVIDAFLSAEDKNYFSHPGVDARGVVRAAITNLQNWGTDRRLVGASTITQQVAKNFLLGSDVSFERKIKEAILSFRIEKAFTKEHILELYLNQIYLGRGAYGVTAAALNYFNKSLDELTLAEAAFLAALPKAPANYDPVRHPGAAKGRRDWVIGRMLDDGHISPAEAREAWTAPIDLRRRAETEFVSADYYAEDIRREIAARYGERALYEGGLAVRASLEPRLQEIAERELRRGLEAYDRAHGWRGAIARLDGLSEGASPEAWADRLAAVPRPPDLGNWRLAVVLRLTGEFAEVGLDGQTVGRIPFAEMRWARRGLRDQRVGPSPRRPADVLSVGDVVAVEAVEGEDRAAFALRQIPDVDGALVALDPHTGRILAMAGGYTYARSQFNRATQALRQPGSAFKPFVYLAALEAGYTPSTIILDAPISFDQGPGLPRWTPSNYSRQFYGPTTMRVGLEKSRNVMTVRLAQSVGMARVGDTAERFGIFDRMPSHLSYALGAGETTLLRLTAAYAMLVNGGKKITPTLIDRVQDRHGRTVFRHDDRDCPGCRPGAWANQPLPQLPDRRETVTDPASAYQVVSMLQGVVQRGTGQRIAVLGRPIAGKTGTTNDIKDTWFIGFTPDLAVGVFVGFDEPRTLGRGETGASVASPIFRDFMAAALEDTPAVPFRVPSGVRLVRVDAGTGRAVSGGGRNVIFEAFKPGTVPTGRQEVLRGSGGSAASGPTTGTGGLY